MKKVSKKPKVQKKTKVIAQEKSTAIPQEKVILLKKR
jgi:hypothetical protein